MSPYRSYGKRMISGVSSWANDGLNTGGGRNLHFVDWFFFVGFILLCVLPPPCSPEPRKHTAKQMDYQCIAYCLNCLNGMRTRGRGVLVGAGLAAQEHTTRVVMLCGIPFFVWPHDKATKADPEKGPIVAWGLPFRPTHR